MARVTVRGTGLEHEVLDGAERLPWLVWGHGLTSSMAGEDRFPLVHLDRLTGLARVVRYDARGHGRSDRCADPEASRWSALALDQLELASALGVDRYVAAGASMGAATAIEAALAAPQRIRALVLVIPPTAWETRAAQRDQYLVMADLAEAARHDVLLAGAAATPPPDPLVGDERWAARFAETLRLTEPDRLAEVFRGAATADLPPLDVVATIHVPTLILAWSGDAGHPIATAERLTEAMPGARLRIASARDQLDRWTDEVGEFLRDVLHDESSPGPP